MMKHFMMTLIALFCFINVQAQKITRSYDNVSMSEALRDLNEQTHEYNISFLYNELEDFRVTTNIRRKSISGAIMQVIGFYPVRVVKRGENEIYVECTHKTERHLTGTIIDENRQPVPYANIAVLNPADSTLLCGGVSNESGIFVIPVDQTNILARISYVGYKTIFKQCNNTMLGTIQMQPETQTLKGVTTPLEQFGSVSEMLSHLPLMMSNGEVAGHGKPEIYINNKKVRNEDELNRIRADEILSAEIITNPGVEYGAEVTSVIRLKTVRKTGEGWSGNFSAAYRQGKEYYANGNAALNYRTRNGMDFFARGFMTSNNQVIERCHLSQPLQLLFCRPRLELGDIRETFSRTDLHCQQLYHRCDRQHRDRRRGVA